MRLETAKFLFDISEACDLVGQFVSGKDFADYVGDLLLRSGVERQVMIIGEALHQALRREPSLERRMTNPRQAIHFRHVLVHGYGVVDNATIWAFVRGDVPVLGQEARALLEE